MLKKDAKLGTKAVNVLQGNKLQAFGVIFFGRLEEIHCTLLVLHINL